MNYEITRTGASFQFRLSHSVNTPLLINIEICELIIFLPTPRLYVKETLLDLNLLHSVAKKKSAVYAEGQVFKCQLFRSGAT